MNIIAHQMIDKNSNYTTIIEVGKVPWDKYYLQWSNLIKKGFSNVIELSTSVPDEIAGSLSPGLFLISGQVSAIDYVENSTRLKWEFVRGKSPMESIGGGQTAGSIGQWRDETK